MHDTFLSEKKIHPAIFMMITKRIHTHMLSYHQRWILYNHYHHKKMNVFQYSPVLNLPSCYNYFKTLTFGLVPWCPKHRFPKTKNIQLKTVLCYKSFSALSSISLFFSWWRLNRLFPYIMQQLIQSTQIQ